MNIPCPYCQHAIKVKRLKAGSFSPECPKCQGGFVLKVTEKDGRLQCTVKKKKPETPAVEPERIEAAVESPELAKTDHDMNLAATGAWEKEPEPADETYVVPAEHLDEDEGEFEVDEPVEKASPPVKATVKVPEKEPEKKEIRLGGYEVLKRLGKGGMGTVFLARQISLDRPVALKVMNKEWAKDPTFLARFIREAYAAAQLVHHNIVQIYDIGEQKGLHYFSMELVKGKTLLDLVKKQGKLDVEEATSYILQAARGLSYAHQQGMIHRDVKPDNLMINDQGVVKVADLGLVKTPGVADPETRPSPEMLDLISKPGTLADVSNVTQVGLAVGTPSYMPPEQWQSAADVDERADIYSLGCAWYVLLTGQPPFKGKTALEVMTKHLVEAPIPPEQIVKRVPPEVSTLLLRMLAKNKEERPISMGEVITEMESLLGQQHGGTFSPGEDQVDKLESAIKQFNEAPAARLRAKVVPVFFLGCAALTVLCCFFSLRLAGGLLGLGALTALFTFVVQGVTSRAYLYLKVREYFLSGRWSDWLSWGLCALLFLALLYVTGLWQFWFGFLFLAAGLTGIYYFFVLKPLQRQRQEPLEQIQKLLKQIRLRGVPEEGAQQFICKYGGNQWEEIFEHLFGYERMLYARKNWAPIGGERRQMHAPWRDPIVRWIDNQQRARKEIRERELLKQIEQKSLEAQGIDKPKARKKAEEAAEAMVQVAAELRSQPEDAAPDDTVSNLPRAAPDLRKIMDAAEEPQKLPPHLKRKLEGRGAKALLKTLTGGKLRFLIGAALLVLFALWIQANGLVPGGDQTWESFKHQLERAEPLGILPGSIGVIFSGFNVGVAGLLLMLSALTKNGKLLFFLIGGALVALLGHYLGVPSIGPFTAPYVALLLGLAMAEFGVIFNRMTQAQEIT